MKKNKIVGWVFSLLAVFLMVGCTTEHYVVALSMDGFRTEYRERAHIPTLDSLGKVGVTASFRPCFPSVTFVNHYAMATGLYPDHSGIVANFFYDANRNKTYSMSNYTAVTDPSFYKGEPIWNTAEKQGVRSAAFFWVGSETAVGGMQPSIWKKYNSSVPFYDRADSVIAWLQLPKKIRPHLIMWYQEQPDSYGHKYSPDSPKVISEIEMQDSVLNYFFSKARKLKQFKKIDFVIVSDHGMATYDKYINLSDYMPQDSFLYAFDGVPTMLYPKPGYLETAYRILKTIPNISVWKRDEVPAQYKYGKNPCDPDLIVLPDVGVQLEFHKGHRSNNKGNHGYDNYSKEMQAIFYAAGPSFKKGVQLPVMENVNLYPLIARLLGLKPAPNDGDMKVIETLLK